MPVGSGQYVSDQWAVFRSQGETVVSRQFSVTVGSVEMTFWRLVLKLVFKITIKLCLVTSTSGEV
ncbi:hypothetical protein [Aquiflexum sp.]|uniref:hypothetical protein n=1 Tax=Aquiflexum sp. TaxID=1872584 RepID=UPI0035946CFA